MERLAPLLAQLDQTLAKRLVRAIGAIVSFRHSGSGLLLSELGAFITSPAQAPAGTKRLSNLLRSEKWQHGLFERRHPNAAFHLGK
jgi:hypothetical protein